MAVNWIKVIKGVGTACSIVSMVCGAVGQSYEIKDAAAKAVAEHFKNKN